MRGITNCAREVTAGLIVSWQSSALPRLLLLLLLLLLRLRLISINCGVMLMASSYPLANAARLSTPVISMLGVSKYPRPFSCCLLRAPAT